MSVDPMEDWAPAAAFMASPNDPIVHGMRWQRERVEALAEVDRLRNIIGELYVQRGKDISTLRNAIRRAFGDSTPRGGNGDHVSEPVVVNRPTQPWAEMDEPKLMEFLNALYAAWDEARVDWGEPFLVMRAASKP